MFRGTSARAVISLLAAVLLALAFFAPTPSFATAHTARHAEARTQPGITLSVKTPRHEKVTVRDCGLPGGPADSRRTRDRHRVTACAASAPHEPERALPAQDPAAAHRPAPPGDLRHRTSRTSTTHSPEALQVFRC
ncbi:hypothetical protein PYK79_44405 [Streptomyces sp. ID05-04B]|uniref:hypothetical protein n=1 Tax=unclassified Streptomyces TaxID=2593676 RepID=UPI000D1A012E|nr:MULTISPECIES: hypothetical protein [unclassified Streptomyces]AVV44930.1 hypothetical protein C6376_29560 [Streptomyces sp. P3]MDX5568921.1 hypothetical protein [Streptomyces sp. ID05-04B]